MKFIPYSNAVGSIMYAIVCNIPDLAYVGSVISVFMSKPTKEHWQAIKWTIRYSKRPPRVDLLFGKSKKSVEWGVGYVNSNYVRCLDSRKSLIGYTFELFEVQYLESQTSTYSCIVFNGSRVYSYD